MRRSGKLGQWLGHTLGKLGSWRPWRVLGNALGRLGDGWEVWGRFGECSEDALRRLGFLGGLFYKNLASLGKLGKLGVAWECLAVLWNSWFLMNFYRTRNLASLHVTAHIFHFIGKHSPHHLHVGLLL